MAIPKIPNKKKAIRNMRIGQEMIEPSGQRASHKMEYVGDITKKRKGDFGVFPSIAPKVGKEKSKNPSDWKTQTPKEAQARGEMIDVNSRRKAQKLAAGSWKKGIEKREAMKDYRINKKNK
jgi:hypothetical protein